MGPDTTLTVYAAKLQGICLALAIVQIDIHQGNSHKHLHIFADNQATIRLVVRPKGHSRAYIIKQIVNKIKALKRADLSVHIY
jgi:hypothetical protein